MRLGKQAPAAACSDCSWGVRRLLLPPLQCCCCWCGRLRSAHLHCCVLAKGRLLVLSLSTMRSSSGTYSWLPLAREGMSYAKPLPAMMLLATWYMAASISSSTASELLSTTYRAAHACQHSGSRGVRSSAASAWRQETTWLCWLQLHTSSGSRGAAHLFDCMRDVEVCQRPAGQAGAGVSELSEALPQQHTAHRALLPYFSLSVFFLLCSASFLTSRRTSCNSEWAQQRTGWWDAAC